MMDSQDNVLKQDITEEAVAAQPANVDNDTVAEAGNAPATTAVDSEPDTEAAPLKMYASKYEVLERVKELAHSDETPAKDEIDHHLHRPIHHLHRRECDGNNNNRVLQTHSLQDPVCGESSIQTRCH